MFSGKNDGKITRIIYTSDLHASDRTFMKFTNLIRMCKADVAIVGGARVYIMGGNDDDPLVDELIRDSGFVVNPDGMVLNIDENYEMISTGYGNITPWNCPRDIPEERLAEKIESMASKVTNMSSCIFNFHVPPINTLLDQCPKLDTSVYPPKPR